MPDPETAVTISANGLSRRFGNHLAVNNITLELKRGEVLGFLGPNGAGKTTTMQMLTGNLAPSAGTIRICGIDLFDEPRAAKARIGYLPEVPPLYRELTVDEYLVGVPALRMAMMVAQGLPPNANVVASQANVAFAKANHAELKPKIDAADSALTAKK